MRAGIKVWIVFFIIVSFTPTSQSLPETRSSNLERRLDTIEKNINSINNAISRLVNAVSIKGIKVIAS